MPVDHANYPGIPADFPIAEIPGALAGAHPKIGLTEEDGKFYATGTSPSEVAQAFDVCEDLVTQMVSYCQRKLAERNGDQTATLRAAFQGLLKKNWCTADQSRWIIAKTAERLDWSLTPSPFEL